MGMRKVEVLRSEQWFSIKFEDLKEGDTFRLFDHPNSEALGPFLAENDPFPCEPEGNWKIICNRTP